MPMPITLLRWPPLVVLCGLAACTSPLPSGHSDRSGAPPGAISVSWSDPAQFSEARENRRESAAAREAWLSALSVHLAEQAAAVLPRNEKLQVRITDVRRAGGYEPWRGPQADNVRIVRDVSAPRITLAFKRLDAGGGVLDSGQRELRDLNFLMRSRRYGSDPLGYEKLLLDDWVGKEFGFAR